VLTCSDIKDVHWLSQWDGGVSEPSIQHGEPEMVLQIYHILVLVSKSPSHSQWRHLPRRSCSAWCGSTLAQIHQTAWWHGSMVAWLRRNRTPSFGNRYSAEWRER
jgi:hypothetical protein